MSSTIIKESDALLLEINKTNAKVAVPWMYDRSWRYGWMFAACVSAVLAATLGWRRLISESCGSYCSLNAKKEEIYFKYANELLNFDYSKMPNLQYPAGILYFYRLLKWSIDYIKDSKSLNFIKESVPIGLYLYFMFCSAYLMKRCRIPAGLMIFFIVPFGILLQGHALMFILPEMVGVTVLLQCLVALIGGYQRISMVLLAGAMSLDASTVIPLLPALMLCLMRTMGMRCAMLWMSLTVLGFTLISGRFLLTNPSGYLSQSLGFNHNSWNPIIWSIHLIHPKSFNNLEFLVKSVIPNVILQSLAQIYLINSRWLKNDGGILGLFSKFLKSNRGHGIRPNPWTPRQTLTVIFESMLMTSLLRFPSLVHAEEFQMIPVMLSGFFCVALSEVVPIPALFGIFTALSFPLTFLYRQFNEFDEDLHFHTKFQESLHFLPMLLLPLVQLTVLVVFKRSDICSNNNAVKSPPPSSSYSIHRRSSSLSRRKIE